MKRRTFDEWFADFVRYNEKGNVKRNFVTPEGYGLGNWVVLVRTGHNKTTEEQKRRLTEAGFVWKFYSQRKFEEWFADFVRYNEDGNVKTNYVTPEGYRLGKWVQSIRTGHYKTTKEQKKRLTEAGFKWRIRKVGIFELCLKNEEKCMMKECTCCGDVCILFEYTNPSKRNYSIYKVKYYNSDKWMYMMKVHDDEFPVPLTNEQIDEILSNPELGASIASNHWLDRYR